MQDIMTKQIQRPSHFYYPIPPKMWENIKTFFPFYNLLWSEDMPKKICDLCPLAAYVHPMVRKGNVYSKLCTVSVIRNGLLTLKEVFKDEGGCRRSNDDYMRAKVMFEGRRRND